MRKQYHFFYCGDRLDAWDVDRLLELSKGLEPETLPLCSIKEIESDYWFAFGTTPTVRTILEHLRLIEEADLSYPIILGADGRVMDGMHRVAKALMMGNESITAVRFPTTPPPDFLGAHPDELPYDDDA